MEVFQVLYHDMTNDYRERTFRITVTLQEGYYKGEIYYEYYTGGAMGHGLHFSTIDNIYQYLTSLQYVKDDDWGNPNRDRTGGFELHNNCGFIIDSDNMNVHFTLRDENGNKLDKTISKFHIEQYIVSIAMTSCVGRGVKRDSRKCAICKNFQRVGSTASGMCLVFPKERVHKKLFCNMIKVFLR